MNEKMCNIKSMFIRNKLHNAVWLNRWISILQVTFHFVQCGNLNKILNVILHNILYGPYLIIRYQRVVYYLHGPYLLPLIMCFCVIVYSNTLSTVQSIRLRAVACLISTDCKRMWNEVAVACFDVISRYFPVKSVWEHEKCQHSHIRPKHVWGNNTKKLLSVNKFWNENVLAHLHIRSNINGKIRTTSYVRTIHRLLKDREEKSHSLDLEAETQSESWTLNKEVANNIEFKI